VQGWTTAPCPAGRPAACRRQSRPVRGSWAWARACEAPRRYAPVVISQARDWQPSLCHLTSTIRESLPLPSMSPLQQFHDQLSAISLQRLWRPYYTPGTGRRTYEIQFPQVCLTFMQRYCQPGRALAATLASADDSTTETVMSLSTSNAESSCLADNCH